MKTLSVFTMAALLSGCMYQSIDTGDITSATKACETHGGINAIRAWCTGSEAATCQDGTTIYTLQFPKAD